MAKSKPLLAIIFFVSLGGFSGSQVLYAIRELMNGFDLLWFIELLVFGFLLIFAFVVLVVIVYVFDQSQGRIENRSAFVERFLGDQNG